MANEEHLNGKVVKMSNEAELNGYTQTATYGALNGVSGKSKMAMDNGSFVYDEEGATRVDREVGKATNYHGKSVSLFLTKKVKLN